MTDGIETTQEEIVLNVFKIVKDTKNQFKSFCVRHEVDTEDQDSWTIVNNLNEIYTKLNSLINKVIIDQPDKNKQLIMEKMKLLEDTLESLNLDVTSLTKEIRGRTTVDIPLCNHQDAQRSKDLAQGHKV